MAAASYANDPAFQDDKVNVSASAAAADAPADAPLPVSEEQQAVDDIASLVSQGSGKVG